MPKRYAIIDENGKVINSIMWDENSPFPEFFYDLNENRPVERSEVILIEDNYASPTDIFINGDIYRKATPSHYSLDITKAKKLDNQGRPVKPSKHEDFSPFFMEVTKPTETKIQQIVNEKNVSREEPLEQLISEIKNFNKEEGRGDAI